VQPQLKPTLAGVKGPRGVSIVLKLVEREELEIHSFLSRVKSERNHTIPDLTHHSSRGGHFVVGLEADPTDVPGAVRISGTIFMETPE
jgi:hypothetical protein